MVPRYIFRNHSTTVMLIISIYLCEHTHIKIHLWRSCLYKWKCTHGAMIEVKTRELAFWWHSLWLLIFGSGRTGRSPRDGSSFSSLFRVVSLKNKWQKKTHRWLQHYYNKHVNQTLLISLSRTVPYGGRVFVGWYWPVWDCCCRSCCIVGRRVAVLSAVVPSQHLMAATLSLPPSRYSPAAETKLS